MVHQRRERGLGGSNSHRGRKDQNLATFSNWCRLSKHLRLSGVLAIGAAMKRMRRSKTCKVQGFTLVELTVAMVVLVVGILGGMMMVIIGVSRDNSNRVDTTATNVAQSVLEQISGAPTNSNPTLVMTDCVQ